MITTSCKDRLDRPGSDPAGSQVNDSSFEGVMFSRTPGAWPEKAFDLELIAPDGYEIYYTTDGSVPDKTSHKYETAIHISGNGNNWLDQETAACLYPEGYFSVNVSSDIPDVWIIRAIAYAPDGSASPVATGTYLPGASFINELGDIAVISIVTDPEGLLGYDHGIMVTGRIYDEWLGSEESSGLIAAKEYYNFPANYSQKGKEWERYSSFELFDGSDRLTIHSDCGIRIHGGMSRAYPNKSLRIYFRDEYGNEALEYPIFYDAENEITGELISEYRTLILRNGGNCADNLIFKDAWQQYLLKGRTFNTQASRPAILYLNGEFWGVYSLCERYDEHYFKAHYGYENILSIKEDELEVGDEDDMLLFDELMSFSEVDLSDKENWPAFEQIMDTESMADYFAAQIYMANADLRPDANIQLWRTTNVEEGKKYADGKWRYMLFDTEYSSSLYYRDRSSAGFDSVQYLKQNHPLFASAMKNETFRDMLAASINELKESSFAPDRINTSLDEWSAAWEGWLDLHIARFPNNPQANVFYLWSIKQFYEDRFEYQFTFSAE